MWPDIDWFTLDVEIGLGWERSQKSELSVEEQLVEQIHATPKKRGPTSKFSQKEPFAPQSTTI